jgi:hypothetical protein
MGIRLCLTVLLCLGLTSTLSANIIKICVDSAPSSDDFKFQFRIDLENGSVTSDEVEVDGPDGLVSDDNEDIADNLGAGWNNQNVNCTVDGNCILFESPANNDITGCSISFDNGTFVSIPPTQTHDGVQYSLSSGTHVPTLPEWGLITLICLLAFVGLRMVGG